MITITGTRARDIRALVTLYNTSLMGITYEPDEMSTYTCTLVNDGELFRTVCKVNGIGDPRATEISRELVGDLTLEEVDDVHPFAM